MILFLLLELRKLPDVKLGKLDLALDGKSPSYCQENRFK